MQLRSYSENGVSFTSFFVSLATVAKREKKDGRREMEMKSGSRDAKARKCWISCGFNDFLVYMYIYIYIYSGGNLDCICAGYRRTQHGAKMVHEGSGPCRRLYHPQRQSTFSQVDSSAKISTIYLAFFFLSFLLLFIP